MAVRKRSNSKYWMMDVQIGDKRYRLSTKRTTRQEAILFEAEFIRKKLDEIQLGVREEISLRDLMDSYLKFKERTVKPKSYDTILHHLHRTLGIPTENARIDFEARHHLDPDMNAVRLSQRHIDRLVEERRAEGFKANTINAEIRTLKAMINWASKRGYAVPDRLTFSGLKTTAKVRYLLPGEEERLLAELDPARRNGIPWEGRTDHARSILQDQYDLVVILLDTGQRVSEILSLPWSAVDTTDWEYIQLYREKVDNEGVVGLTQRVREILQRRWESRTTRYVFPAYDGTKVIDKPRQFAPKGIRLAIERAGLNAPDLVRRYGRFTIHSLRDTFASRLVQAGVSLYEVQKLLGHSSPMMTQKYAHLDRGAGVRAAKVLDMMSSQKCHPNGQMNRDEREETTNVLPFQVSAR